MPGSIWLMLLYVFLAGAVGGVVNALMTDNGFLLPRRESVDQESAVLRPGFVGNVLVGAVAAVVSWGLYGPMSAYLVAGTPEALAANPAPERLGLSLASLVGALLVGVGGARWLSNEVDKSLLRAAAIQAALGPPSPAASQRIAMAHPAQALRAARGMK